MWELVLHFHGMSSRDQIQFMGLDSKYLYRLIHLAGPRRTFRKYDTESERGAQ